MVLILQKLQSNNYEHTTQTTCSTTDMLIKLVITFMHDTYIGILYIH